MELCSLQNAVSPMPWTLQPLTPPDRPVASTNMAWHRAWHFLNILSRLSSDLPEAPANSYFTWRSPASHYQQNDNLYLNNLQQQQPQPQQSS